MEEKATTLVDEANLDDDDEEEEDVVTALNDDDDDGVVVRMETSGTEPMVRRAGLQDMRSEMP